MCAGAALDLERQKVKTLTRIYFALFIAVTLRAQSASDNDIRTILSERIDHLHQGVGIVVGIVDRSGRRFVSYGNFGVNDARPVDENTVFEIGSVTKIFTATILADMVQRGEVALGDPVAKYLPAEVSMPRRGAKQVTLLDLATHTSGLPRMPTNFGPADLEDRGAEYTFANLYQFLSGFQLTRNIGSKFEYSNMGVALLGHALARRAGMDYEALVRTRVAGVLGMEHTQIQLTPEMKEHFAQGHDTMRQPAPDWDQPVFASAGALRSNARDMLTFMAANLGYVESPLGPAMRSMTKVRRPAIDGFDIAVGWIVARRHGREILWHDGEVGGYQSYVGYDAKAGVGVVVLGNMDVDVSDIGIHVLDPSAPLEKLKALSSAELAFAANPEYSGRLERLRSGSISVRLADGRVIDAVLPKTADLTTETIAANYNTADQVSIVCKPAKVIHDPVSAIHLHLELTSLRLLRRASSEELADEVTLLSWQAGENLFKQPELASSDAAWTPAELERVRKVNLDYVAKLPDFVADETAWRYGSSVMTRQWQFLDAIESEITVKGNDLSRQHIRKNGIPRNGTILSLGGQLWAAFGTNIKPLFDPACHVKIDFVKRKEVNGKQLGEYSFAAAAGGCFGNVYAGSLRNHYNPARTGRILVDGARGNVIRYEQEDNGFPEKFGVDRHTVVESWDYVTIGGSSYLVPMSAEFAFRGVSGYMGRTVVEYKNHRHFEAATKVTFDKDE